MARTLTKEEISQLPIETRLDLIETIWDSLSQTEIPIPESHKAALDAALDELREHPETDDSWDDVRRALSRGR